MCIVAICYIALTESSAIRYICLAYRGVVRECLARLRRRGYKVLQNLQRYKENYRQVLQSKIRYSKIKQKGTQNNLSTDRGKSQKYLLNFKIITNTFLV